MAWQKNPFQNLMNALHMATDALIQAHAQEALQLQQRLETMLKGAQSAQQLHIPPVDHKGRQEYINTLNAKPTGKPK